MGKCVFNDLWLQNPKYGKWLRKDSGNDYSAFCTVCMKTFKLGTMGVRAVESHQISERHNKNLTDRNKMKVNSIMGYVCSTSKTSTQNEPVAGTSSTTTSDSVQSSQKVNIRAAFGTTDTLKAEVLWTLSTVCRHQSYSSNEEIGSLFQLMFPDSEIARTFSCGEDKSAYMTKFGLAHFIRKALISQIGTDTFIIMFDESLCKTTKNKQLDVHIRYWTSDGSGSHVQSRYLDSQFMGHATAQDLLIHFKVNCLLYMYSHL